MTVFNRRTFMQVSAAAAAGAGAAFGAPPNPAPESNKIRLGVFVNVSKDPDEEIAKVKNLGFPTCQVYVGEPTPELGKRVQEALAKHGVEATTAVCLSPGPTVWNFYEGPLTIGLVPRGRRRQRMEYLKRTSDFCKVAGIPAVHTHNGFIPENPNDELYKETVDALREVVGYCKANGHWFLYETGQETPVTLLRCITDVGLDNQGINLDTANLILYGKGNPVDALDVFGKYVRGLHAKDGLFPTDPNELGKEVPIGQGNVDFPTVIRRLKEMNYTGAITIEREISGPQQTADIKKAKAYLESLIG
jgi:sugar phosphate isomerase/epimerase